MRAMRVGMSMVQVGRGSWMSLLAFWRLVFKLEGTGFVRQRERGDFGEPGR